MLALVQQRVSGAERGSVRNDSIVGHELHILAVVTFRDRLLGTLRRLQPVLEEPGVLVVGSEVPNLLQPDAASTLVVSQDVDVAIPINRVDSVKHRLRTFEGFVQSAEEPSIFVPTSPALVEANFLGLDPSIRDASETYLREDPELPLMVFGPLGLLRPGPVIDVEGLRIPLPRTADLMIEKLLTDRTGEKGARDLLVVAGLLAAAGPADLDEMVARVGSLGSEGRHTVRSSLTLLSLIEPRDGMPDPSPFLGQVGTCSLELKDHCPMRSEASDRLHARVRAVRTRAQVLAWQYRQRNLAAGVWFRLRRVLADAEEAYAIADEDAQRLLAEGYEAMACGREVAPPKTIVFVDEQRLARIASRRPMQVGLGPAFLAATAIALVPFDPVGRAHARSTPT